MIGQRLGDVDRAHPLQRRPGRVAVDLEHLQAAGRIADDIDPGIDGAGRCRRAGRELRQLADRRDTFAAGTLRGNSNNKNDSWYYFGLTVTVRSFIDEYKRIAGLPSYHRDKKVGCPVSRYMGNF